MIDTAAIRAHWGLPKDTASQNVQMIDILCDAVDELRSQLDRRAERWEHDYWRALARAEAAEADLREWKTRSDLNVLRAEAAEARIAAALAVCDPYDRFGSTLPNENWVPTTAIRRALTGDTL